jgi:predicted O-methyltransferase YrrM
VKPADIRGLISEIEGEALAALAAEVKPPSVIVELGSFRGKSTAYLASRAKVPVYAIDRWTLGGQADWNGRHTSKATYKAFEDNLRAVGVWERVKRIMGDTAAAGLDWKGPLVGLLFVDADHTITGVTADIEAWEPHLAPGAVVAFDDYWSMYPDVIAVADAWAAKNGLSGEVIDGRLFVVRLP